MHVVLTKSGIQYGLGEFKPSIFMEGSLMQTPNCWSSISQCQRQQNGQCKQTDKFWGIPRWKDCRMYMAFRRQRTSALVLDWRIDASYVREVKTQIKITKKCRWSGCPNWHKICCRQMFMESSLSIKAIFSCDLTSPLCCI